MEIPSVTLKYPIDWDGKTITELSFSRLKAKDIRGMSANPKMSDLLDLTIISTGMPKNFIDRLDASDANKCAEVIADFL